MSPLRPVSAHLDRLSRTAGGAPLLTHYGPAGERTELSVASFANWVAKTVNLLADLGAAADDEVVLAVLLDRPAHWMGLVWPFALWRAGGAATVAPMAAADDAYLLVTGPDAPAEQRPLTIACSLDPWARPVPNLPEGVLDFGTEALAQPDAAPAAPGPLDATAWVDGARELTVGDVAGLEPITDRVLARPSTAWEAVSLLARAILGGGSVVLVESGGDPARTASAEKARVVE